MRTLRLFVLVAAAGLSMATTYGDGGFDPPASDVCSPGATTGAASLELGTQDENRFDRINQDQVLAIVQGFQGSDMLPLRYRVTGTTGDCLSVSVDIYRCVPLGSKCSVEDQDSRQQLASSTRALRAYPDGDSQTTFADFVEFNLSVQSGDRILIVADVAGAAVTTHAWIEMEGEEPPDAGTDASSR